MSTVHTPHSIAERLVDGFMHPGLERDAETLARGYLNLEEQLEASEKARRSLIQENDQVGASLDDLREQFEVRDTAIRAAIEMGLDHPDALETLHAAIRTSNPATSPPDFEEGSIDAEEVGWRRASDPASRTRRYKDVATGEIVQTVEVHDVVEIHDA